MELNWHERRRTPRASALVPAHCWLHFGSMDNTFDVIIVGGAPRASAPRGDLQLTARRPCCLRRRRVSAAAATRKTSGAIRSISAASGSTRATATPGSRSPRRRASRWTEAIRRGRRRIPASSRSRTTRTTRRRRTVTGRSGSAPSRRAAIGLAMPLSPAARGTPTCGQAPAS